MTMLPVNRLTLIVCAQVLHRNVNNGVLGLGIWGEGYCHYITVYLCNTSLVCCLGAV